MARNSSNSTKEPVTKPINALSNSSKEQEPVTKPINAISNSSKEQVPVKKPMNVSAAAASNNTNNDTKPDAAPPTRQPPSPSPKESPPESPPPSESKPPPSPPPPSPPPDIAPPPPDIAPPPLAEELQVPPPPVDSTPPNPPSPPSEQNQPSTDNSPSTPTPPQDNSTNQQSLNSTPTQRSPSRAVPKSTPRAPPGNDNPPPPPKNGSPALPNQPKSTTSVDTPPSSPSVPKVSSDKSPQDGITITTGVGAGIGVFVGAVTLGLILMIVWFVRKSRRNRSGLSGRVNPSPFSPNPHSDSSSPAPLLSPNLVGGARGNFLYSPEAVGANKLAFTYEELTEATNGFSANNILGEGGFGCVYKGYLSDGREIAVKRLKRDGGQGEREFRAEVAIISRVHHRHLVSLVGYCISENKRLLVFDYVPNNTLHHHLHGEGRPVMEWATRVKVAASAARGIAYLHEDCHPRIIHRDIKSSNILLDNDFVAQVSDFGLAKLAVDSNSHVSTRVMGTFGYMAPEYASSGKLTEKSDVFSFGVVLLELITGCKPVDKSRPMGEESLVEWARPLLLQALDKGGLEKLVDQRLESNYVESEMIKLIEAAAACVRHLASKRPRMSQVVRALDNIIEFPDLTNGMKPGQSEVLNPREKSAEIRMFQRMAFQCQDNSTGFFERSHS